MQISYKNRKGELHYLKAVKTKKGGIRYYVVKNLKDSDELLTQVPDGFEFHELPFDGQVVLRKKLQSTITDEEFAILDSVMKKHKTVKDYIIEKKANALMLYIAGHNRKDFFFYTNKQFKSIQRYDEKLIFGKDEDGLYEVQRYCYLGSIDDWITIGSSRDLKSLAEKYCYHIDKDSLYEFWFEGQEDPEADIIEINETQTYSFLRDLD
jgi:hypothetical protein